ncbi:MAG TPA: electron transfer flavoprotein subunit beta/FixA family protein [Thermoanaerobaculia bacterium]|nr:electron transfer flavoprotein subunit beta/FixA family protein [Thermoanaerobaculia bacterium]
MNSVVCVSQVPDTESRIRIASDGLTIEETGLKFIVSPYDEYALEEAIRLKEKSGGDVTVVSFGPDRVAQALRECLARGATKAIHIKGDSGKADSLGIARVLAAAIRETPFDLVFLGKQGVGTDNSLVGPMLAELLDLPHVNVVTRIEIGEGSLTAHREIEGAEEVIETTLPAVIMAQKGLNEPRYASLKGIMAAKKIPIETKTTGDLGLTDDEIYGSRVRVVSLSLPPEKTAGKKIDGSDPAAAAAEIIRYIRDEAKAL